MKKSIIQRYLILSILSGVIMGVIFPMFASLFMTAKSETAASYFTVACVFAGIIVGVISFGIGRVTLIKTIGKLNEHFKYMGEGDFTHELHIESEDAIGELAYNLNEMKDS
ncbi:HAMP domain-containing protein [Konateibacter massiliensis]|uniref:HAMP domain-containing protein n=1 Tax=Konateibacter massiliensis TaxID=2002841 RepID=UPI000C15B300|nr:HAMP domain-containing protein [Konateibacter massiliensis]